MDGVEGCGSSQLRVKRNSHIVKHPHNEETVFGTYKKTVIYSRGVRIPMLMEGSLHRLELQSLDFTMIPVRAQAFGSLVELGLGSKGFGFGCLGV